MSARPMASICCSPPTGVLQSGLRRSFRRGSMLNTVNGRHGACLLPWFRLRAATIRFLHCEALEDPSALRHQCELRAAIISGDLRVTVSPNDHLAAGGGSKVPRRVHARGRFARSVAAKQTEHACFAKFERHVAEHVTVAVESVDVTELKRISGQDRPPACGDLQPPRRGCPRRSLRRSAAA